MFPITFPSRTILYTSVMVKFTRLFSFDLYCFPTHLMEFNYTLLKRFHRLFSRYTHYILWIFLSFSLFFNSSWNSYTMEALLHSICPQEVTEQLQADQHYVNLRYAYWKKSLKRIVAHIYEHRKMSSNQYSSYTKLKSTETQTLEPFNDWTLAFDHKKDVHMIYFDFMEAFNKGSHSKLLNRL